LYVTTYSTYDGGGILAADFSDFLTASRIGVLGH
jgi:hypothetical protein